jgi:Leucine-rich repeat (LRR) protein
MEINISNQDLKGHFNVKEYCKENNINIEEVKYLICYKNKLESLDLKGLKNLEYLDCRDNELKSLDVIGLKNLKS